MQGPIHLFTTSNVQITLPDPTCFWNLPLFM